MNGFALQLQLAQFKRALQWHGADYTFIKSKTGNNGYGEPKVGESVIKTVRGLFYTSRGSININFSAKDGGTVKTKDSPMILCAYAEGAGLSEGFEVTIGQTLYRVTALTDVEQMHTFLDISLEAVQNGTERI